MSNKKPHVKTFEFETFFVSLIVSVASAIICMQIISRIGFTPNTSIIGALIAMAIARLPFKNMQKFRSLDRQNLVQTMTSGAGFAAANCTLLSVGIFYAAGDMRLIFPMLIGSGIATLIGMHMVYRLFDSEVFPATAAWPPGIATAQALIAGDEGGKKGNNLLVAIVIGMIGSSKLFTVSSIGMVGLPMAGIGIAFIANVFAMVALAIGLLIRGYFVHIIPFITPAAAFFGISDIPANLGSTYIPHGFMIGAGIISLIQALLVIFKHSSSQISKDSNGNFSISNMQVKKTLAVHLALFAIGAAFLACISGLWYDMSLPSMLLWLVWCTFSAIVAPILVGLSAMHSGWFPGFAVTVIFLSLGILMGFPPHALILLTGYVASTGPCFADMGFDLKTGWIIRGSGADPAYEMDGRRQQVIAELVGGVVAVVVTAFLMHIHFKLDMLPPISKVFASTVNMELSPTVLKQFLYSAAFGGILQMAGGAKKAIGILFATGLLINNPLYGAGLLVALLIRLPLEKKYKPELEIYGAGFVAGGGLFGFGEAIMKAFL